MSDESRQPRNLPPPWTGLAIAISADRVVIDSSAAGAIVQLIDYYYKREGYSLAPGVRTIRDVLLSVCYPASGHPDVRQYPTSAQWTHDEIGTFEAAELMSCSREHANRLARTGILGPTRKAGNRRFVSKAHVQAYLSERNNPS